MKTLALLTVLAAVTLAGCGSTAKPTIVVTPAGSKKPASVDLTNYVTPAQYAAVKVGAALAATRHALGEPGATMTVPERHKTCLSYVSSASKGQTAIHGFELCFQAGRLASKKKT